jgi:uncharacterized protein (TIGR04255 family)
MAYPTNKLDKVIFQANFISIDSIKRGIGADIIIKFETISSGKIVERKNSNISFLGDGTSIQHDVASRWIFKGTILSVVIQNDSIQVATSKYENYESFHPIVREVFDYFKGVYKPTFTRIALRYINKIGFTEGSTFDFNGIINPALLAPSYYFKDKSLSRSMGSIFLKNRDFNIDTTFNYGFFNSAFPNMISKREFILDYDTSFAIMDQNPDVMTVLMNLRNTVNELFEASIEEGLRKILRNQV